MRQYASYNFLHPLHFTCMSRAKTSTFGDPMTPTGKFAISYFIARIFRQFISFSIFQHGGFLNSVIVNWNWCCCCSVSKLCPTLWDPMDCSMPGFPVLYYLQEFAQTHIRWVGDAILPYHPLSSTSPPVFNLSQPRGLFQWVGSSHQVAKVLKLQLQYQSSNENSGLMSFKIDWFGLLSVQGTL